jgi:DNA-binding NtrC family response regulator
MNTNSKKSQLIGHTILIMDDDINVRELFELNLERFGCATVLASGGDEALELYKQSLKSGNCIDAIIIDLTIPGNMGGLEFSKKLREINSEVKLIVSSGHTDAPEMVEFQKHGFDGAIEKNFDRELMKKTLEKILLN